MTFGLGPRERLRGPAGGAGRLPGGLRGRTPRRCTTHYGDVQHFGNYYTYILWMRVAEDRARWGAIGEAYVQQWTLVG
jgi:hypothetical protein